MTTSNLANHRNVFTGICQFPDWRTGSRDFRCDYYPWCIWPHCTYPPRHKTWGPTPSCYWHLVVITGDLFKLVHLRTYPLPPPLLTPSGDYWNTYSWQFASYCNASLSGLISVPLNNHSFSCPIICMDTIHITSNDRSFGCAIIYMDTIHITSNEHSLGGRESHLKLD